MQSGNNGNLLTSTIMNASSYGSGWSWTAPNGSMWVSTSYPRNLPGPVSVNGTVYNGTGSTQTWVYNCNNAMNYVQVNAPAAFTSSVTVAGYYTTTSNFNQTTQYDTVVMFDTLGQGFTVMQVIRGDDGSYPAVRSHSKTSSGVQFGPTFDISAGHTYWFNVKYDVTGGQAMVAMYDPSNSFSLVGTSTSPVTPNNSIQGYVQFGRDDNHGNVPQDTGQGWFGQIIVDSTNAAWPLLPSGGTDTPTAPPAVYDGTTTGVETPYTTSTTQLSANWSAASDPQSGITGYQYAIGTTAGGTNVVAWTGLGNVLSVTKTSLSLTNGQKYYFSVKAVNGVGTVGPATNSPGQTVDTTPPSAPPAVYDGTTTGVEASTTTSTTQLSANWSASTDSISGISGYQYAIGTSAGGTNVVGWTSVGNVLSVTKTGLSLTVGTTYYFSVKATDNAGLVGSATNSSGCTVVSSGSTIYFQDNFEGWAVYGGAWSSVNGVNSNHTLDTSANYAEAGDKSLQLYGVNTPGNYGAYLTKNFSPVISGGINVRFFVFLPTGYGAANSNCSRRMLRVWCGSNYGVITMIDDTPSMQEVGAWGSVSGPALTENAWHCIEMHINAPSTSTPMQFWVDGVSVGTLNGNFSGSSTFNQIQFGDVLAGSSGGSGTATFYVDELVVANSYIGTTIQSPVTYFSDTFENWTVYGGAWSTVTGINSSHTLDTSTTEAAAGTHSLELTGYDIENQYGAYLTKNFSPTITSDIYVRFYLFLPTGFEAANTGCARRLLHAWCGSSRVQISILGGAPFMDQVGNWSEIYWPSQLSENTWHCLEVHCTPPAATTYIEFWVDGVLNTTAMTGNFSGSTAWNSIDFGDISLGTGNNGNATYYMDEVIVSNSYIPLLP